jgi:3-oxoadipate enol-lactonase
MPTLEVNGTTLHYSDDGPRDAPAVIFGHSLFFDADMFAAQVAELSSDHRVVTYDHRGQGRSAPAPREQLDMDTLTDDAAALIEALGLAPCTYVGNSMGGFVALRLAARRPDLVASVVAAGSSADVEGSKAEFDPLVSAMGEHGVAPVLDVVTHIMLGDHTMAERPELTASSRERLGRLGPEIADPAWQVVHREAVLDELAATEVPILVIAGAEDHAYPLPKSEQIAATAPNARLEVVERVGHSVLLEDPERANALLRDHLAGLPERTRV